MISIIGRFSGRRTSHLSDRSTTTSTSDSDCSGINERDLRAGLRSPRNLQGTHGPSARLNRRWHPAPRPPSNIPAPDVKVAASAGWTSSRPGTLRGVVVVFEQGSAAALAQVMALGGQTPAPVQLGGRSVIVESSPVIDETIATWRESPTVVALLHSRGLQTAELQQVIAGLRFAQN
jgi:hypothetical protein